MFLKNVLPPFSIKKTGNIFLRRVGNHLQDHNLNSRHRENLKSHILSEVLSHFLQSRQANADIISSDRPRPPYFRVYLLIIHDHFPISFDHILVQLCDCTAETVSLHYCYCLRDGIAQGVSCTATITVLLFFPI
jgi:hypothetical protein